MRLNSDGASPGIRRGWRSLLFVPADQPELLRKATGRGADALILDLEDAVAPVAKVGARASLATSVSMLTGQGASVLVRVNADTDLILEDLAAMPDSVAAIILPKADSVTDVAYVARAIARREEELRLPSGSFGLIPLIESPKGLRYAFEIAEAPRVVGLALGTEDFALALGVAPSPEALALPAQIVCLAAAAADIAGFALPTSIANFRDIESWAAGAAAGRALGASGALCVHPAQIAIINETFSPSDEEKAWANAIVRAWMQKASGAGGTMTVEGQMVDEPVFRRARNILARSGISSEWMK